MLNYTPYMRRFRGFMTPMYETSVKRAYEAMSDVERWIYHVVESNPTLVARNENDGDDTEGVTGMADETQGVARRGDDGARWWPTRALPPRAAPTGCRPRQPPLPACSPPTTAPRRRQPAGCWLTTTPKRRHLPPAVTPRLPPPATELVPPH